jgi:hypothetical protein
VGSGKIGIEVSTGGRQIIHLVGPDLQSGDEGAKGIVSTHIWPTYKKQEKHGRKK